MDGTIFLIGGVVAAVAIAKFPIGAPKKTLVQKLPSRLAKEIGRIVPADEKILVQLCGSFQQALVCTDRRVILLKGGFMVGQMFGCNAFQLRHSAVMGIEVKFQMLTGFVEINSGGMQNVPRAFWSRNEAKSASRAPNCIAIYRWQAAAFRDACTEILHRATATGR
jgi:hypothetical protein